MYVKELMTKPPRVCTGQDSLDDVAGWMLENDCGSLPVVSGEGQPSVVGMVTDRDICLAAHREGKSLKEIPVETAMSREVLTCAPGDDLSEAAEKMRRGKVRRLPVTGQNGIEGILSLGRIASAGREPSGVDDEQVAATLSSICEPTSDARAVVSAS